MKIKTTISLESGLVQELNRVLAANGSASLSEFIEDMLRRFLSKEQPAAEDSQELEIINQNVNRLNQEAEDVLTYQVEM